jgi:hypothetical protein
VASAAAFFLGASPLALGQSTTSPSSTSSPAGQSATEGSGASSQMSTAEKDLTMKLQRDGYTRVRDIHSTAEGTTAKAMRDGKEVSLVIDSSGKVKER